MMTNLQRALEHARTRWCWDDASNIEELYEARPPGPDETPEAWVDAMAEKYDLMDPREYGL